MESMGAEHEHVYMRSLCESLGGNADFWLYTLAPGSITEYDMFTDLLIKEWGKSIDKSIHPNNDCVVDDQSDEDDQDNHNEIIDNFPHQIDSSSPDPTVDMPLNDSSMQTSDNDQISILQDYDLDIGIEGELIKILSSLAQEGTNKEEEQNYLY